MYTGRIRSAGTTALLAVAALAVDCAAPPAPPNEDVTYQVVCGWEMQYRASGNLFLPGIGFAGEQAEPRYVCRSVAIELPEMPEPPDPPPTLVPGASGFTIEPASLAP